MLGCMKSSALLFLSKVNKWPRGWTALLMKSSWKTQYLALYMCLPLVVRTLSLPVHACHGCESFIQCRVLCPPWNWFSVSLFDIHTPSFLPACSQHCATPIQLAEWPIQLAEWPQPAPSQSPFPPRKELSFPWICCSQIRHPRLLTSWVLLSLKPHTVH